MIYKVFATSFFEKELRNLSRKYRRIFDDYKDLLGTLEQNPYQGDRLQGCIALVFKIRMASKDMQKGKSGGFRIIYLVREVEKSVYLLTLYSKGERENIDISEVNEILKKLGLDRNSD